jgi:hypothetical protein
MKMLLRSRSIVLILVLLATSLMISQPAHAAVDCSEPGVICKSGAIGNETWSPGNVYVIYGDDVVVPAGVTLTIQAGTIVKFNTSSMDLIVDGILNVNGLEGNPVYFTSAKDDDVGGDTDHNTTPPGAGDWGRIQFRGGSSGSFSHSEFRYGGNYQVGMVYLDAGSSVVIDQGIFKNSSYCAINSHPTVDPTLTGMTPTDFTGSRYNGICMRGVGIGVNTTWDETEAAYVLLDDVTVTSGFSLTLGTGVVVKPAASWVELYVDGSLNANGSAGAPVYFTSIKDDSVGGQTNNNADQPAIGDWSRIYFRSGSSGTLDQIGLKYGRDAVYVENASPQLLNCSLIYNVIGLSSYGSSTSPRINNCNIIGNTDYGVYNDQTGNWIDATNNWWGSPTGPYDPSPPGTDGTYNYGSGDRVNDYVRYSPWIAPTFNEYYIPIARRR